MRKIKTVACGMSGGVDSAVAAHFLKQKGEYDIYRVMLSFYAPGLKVKDRPSVRNSVPLFEKW